ncbi:uncharacterized protein LOC132303597 isoform X2 [Cornus florida]|uniref:uncharacterized protein LOC132303597 isoform X2 n=1 Tax=Cornus florida TaxID=4283 RepID=UPI0028A0BD65|nr:uncharacterized protein LOC132303597 isoform X2 [Cornus florida]
MDSNKQDLGVQISSSSNLGTVFKDDLHGWRLEGEAQSMKEISLLERIVLKMEKARERRRRGNWYSEGCWHSNSRSWQQTGGSLSLSVAVSFFIFNLFSCFCIEILTLCKRQ